MRLERVLVSYHFGPRAIPLGEQVARAFERAGATVCRFDSAVHPSPWDIPKRLMKSLSKLVGQKKRLARHWEKQSELATAERFRRAAVDFRPQLMLVIRGEPVEPEVIADVRRATGATAVLWWVKTTRWQDALERERAAYDAVFTIHGRLAEEGIGHLPAFALDSERYYPAPTREERWPLLFVGCWSLRRQAYLEAIADLPLTVVGPNWKKRLPPGHALRRCLGPEWESGDQLLARYQHAGIVVDIGQIERQADEGETMRVADVPACGTVLLTEPSSGVTAHFAAGDEVVLFDTPAALREQVQALLADPVRRAAMATAAARRAAQLPTFDDRVRAILVGAGLS